MRELIKRISLILLFLSSGLLWAQGESMSADEFNQLLSGNTMNGVWGEANYQQYFDPSGDTTYQEEGKQETFGTWRINPEGQFCSVWPPSKDEFCYNVLKDGDTLLWDDGSGNIYPATVEAGKTF